jgi:hypothetical protein
MAALIAVPTLAPASAEAKEYCREYTKTVSIGGKAERAYGTACQQPDGSWEIQSLEGSSYGRDQVRDVIYDDLNDRYSNRRYNNVVIKERYSTPRPRYRHHRASHYAPFVLNFGFGDRYDRHHGKKHYKHKKYAHGHHWHRGYNGRHGYNHRDHKARDYKRHKNSHASHTGKVYKNSRHHNHR